MNSQLREDQKLLGDILKQTLVVAEKYFSVQDSRPPGRFVPPLATDELPEIGIGATEVLKLFERTCSPYIANSAGPRYFGLVTGGSTPASVAGDWLVSTYDQNACGSHDSIAPQIEHQTIHYMKQLFGMDEAYFGSFVTGATMSNFVGLALGRQWLGEQFGVDVANAGLGRFPIRIVSASAHASVVKSLSMLGIGRDALHRIETLPEREAIDLSALGKYLSENPGPVIVVANAGTVNTGDFDDLQGIAALKNKYRFWMHTDGAFGGFAACSQELRHLTAGINASDSITIDAHKWLNVPYDAAMQFSRHPQLQLKVFQNSAAYLGDPAENPDFLHYTPESSRRWRALPAWFSLRAYGRQGHREIVERNCLLARQLGGYIQRSRHLVLLSPVRLNIVCFTLRESPVTFEIIKNLLAEVRDEGDAYFTPTLYKGTPAIRAAISNWQTEEDDIEVAFKALERWAQAIKQNM